MNLLRRNHELELVVSFDKIVTRRPWTDLKHDETEKINDTNKHAGQYKLFLSDLLAFAMARPYMPDRARAIVVVVAGASPGQHWTKLIPILLASIMRKHITFELYDSEELCSDMQTFAQDNTFVNFHKQLFTAETAQEIKRAYKNSYIVFLSDIRSPIHEREGHNAEDETLIQDNMRLQAEAVAIMLPAYSCLKFHAPHATKGHEMPFPPFQYLHGVLCLQAYTYNLSAEFRLHVTLDDITPEKLANQQWYDPVMIEECAFSHNTQRRPYTHTDERFDEVVWRAAVLELDVNLDNIEMQRLNIARYLHRHGTHDEHHLHGKHHAPYDTLRSLLSRMLVSQERS